MRKEKEWLDTPQATPTAGARTYWWVQIATESHADDLKDILPVMLRWCAKRGYELMAAFKGQDDKWRFKAARFWDRTREEAAARRLSDKVERGLQDIASMS